MLSDMHLATKLKTSGSFAVSAKENTGCTIATAKEEAVETIGMYPYGTHITMPGRKYTPSDADITFAPAGASNLWKRTCY